MNDRDAERSRREFWGTHSSIARTFLFVFFVAILFVASLCLCVFAVPFVFVVLICDKVHNFLAIWNRIHRSRPTDRNRGGPAGDLQAVLDGLAAEAIGQEVADERVARGRRVDCLDCQCGHVDSSLAAIVNHAGGTQREYDFRFRQARSCFKTASGVVWPLSPSPSDSFTIRIATRSSG